ncbi:hypothetical protein A0130_13920 [Leifsonia xyli]|nr:hypothetical protein A0130_13920 [Leifsonia xyli]
MNAPAGWYPDPEYPGQQRYWDGSAWTANRAPVATAAPATAAPAPAATATATASSLPTIALVLAIFGFVLGIIPFAAWFAWLLFVPSVILAVRSLTRRDGGRGMSIASLIIVGVGWLISLVMGLGSFGALSQSRDPAPAAAPPATTATPSASPSAPSPTPPPAPSASPLPGVGQTVTSRAGVGFTVTAVQCGLDAQDGVIDTITPKGQFCRLDFTVANGSPQPQDLTRWDIYGYIGKSRYEAEDQLGRFGDSYFSTTVNPGLSVPCTVYFDVPPGASLDRVKLMTDWWGGDGATVALR